jgi:hypothetical protein
MYNVDEESHTLEIAAQQKSTISLDSGRKSKLWCVARPLRLAALVARVCVAAHCVTVADRP